ncbi:hypothetical protein PsorP6_005764 [Peronosclerospora sorghi]|uniref:Uncharacterized protein n=1 Tax=Peronosclerospora sorghi TaxID=230839 RepID=A0ACC0W5L9_9STRA|nr:hypothetical protein PsorP6_005764 [Peronosclerospora sorghi]
MQRYLVSVKLSPDSNFVLSGSDDTNIRIWKAEASKKLSKVAPRERRRMEYNESPKERYQHLREINRISMYVSPSLHVLSLGLIDNDVDVVCFCFCSVMILLYVRHRHVPKAIKKVLPTKREASARDQKKMANRRAHAKEGPLPHTNIREKVVVEEME